MSRIYRAIGSLVVFAAFLVCADTVHASASANSLDKIEMGVYIDSAGNAAVEEIWHVSVNSGTEGYKPYGNLARSEITDFSVTDDSGTEYEYQAAWDVQGSFESKKYKSSILKTPDGVELCWGISEYGNRTYTLRYKITNFVNQYDDAQGVYFSLMPREMEQTPSQAVITIASGQAFTADTAKIWAFGYRNGTISFKDGAIVMDSGGRLAASDYMTALIKFEGDYFSAGNRVPAAFEDIRKEATSGVKAIEKDNTLGAFLRAASAMFTALIAILPFLLMMSLPVFLRKKFGFGKSGGSDSKGFDFGDAGKSIPSLKEVSFWREIPCDKDIEKAYWVITQYSISSKSDFSDVKSGIIGAVILKWLRNGSITVTKLPKKLFGGRDDNYAIDLRSLESAENQPEAGLLSMLKRAAGDNGILEPKEFEKWCRANYLQVELWFNSVIGYATSLLEANGMVTITTKEIPIKFFGKTTSTRTVTVKRVNPAMKDEAIRMQGLKRFLTEFSAIAQREAFEVHVWEEYLMFAQLLGVAKKVEEQLSRIYPDFRQDLAQNSNFDMNISMLLVRTMSDTAFYAARQGRMSAESRAIRNSGGGGSSFSGGGGGAGGRSSGGGFR